eukprot:CAMPEP_0174252712 /NCGR_PEP_ID=MMETSP0439-20130205/2076_1 /TAXON_ID=0 /ORGANISM="Stereomyxa ramosa, Strain Chinc5" /LENGTH=423 /DNA_ID=CAMNT_0015333297 /DNA_START=18 /DNA_END=1289 /DNA_ORIENTATION=-
MMDPQLSMSPSSPTSFSLEKEKIEFSFKSEKIKVLLLEGVAPHIQPILRKEGYQVEYLKGRLTHEELMERIPDVHVIGIRSGTKMTAEVLARAKKLLCIACFCIGTNQVDLDVAKDLGIPVFNSPFGNTRSVAELIVSQIISLSRHLGDKNKEMHQAIWNKSSKGCNEIRGKTVGIIGYGHIGSQLSVLCEAMGMTVYFYDIIMKLPLGNSTSVRTLDELLETCDYITCHVPETPETKMMIGKEQIEKMKPGSYLLNASRGTVVDIDAAAEALKSGHLAGAYFDVFPKEPITEDNPLLNLPNVLLTPHIGGSTEEAQVNIGTDVADKVVNYVSGGSTAGAVNFPNISLPFSFGSHRILNIHKNVPGVLRDINNILAEFNVTKQVLGTEGTIGYLIVEVDRQASKPIKLSISKLEQSIKTRILY